MFHVEHWHAFESAHARRLPTRGPQGKEESSGVQPRAIRMLHVEQFLCVALNERVWSNLKPLCIARKPCKCGRVPRCGRIDSCGQVPQESPTPSGMFHVEHSRHSSEGHSAALAKQASTRGRFVL